MKLTKNELHSIEKKYSDKDVYSDKDLYLINNNEDKTLIIKGQGSVSVVIDNNVEPFSMILSTSDKVKGFELLIDKQSVSFYAFVLEQKELLGTFDNIGLDLDLECNYWFSLDSHNSCLRYGKGELRLLTVLAEYNYSMILKDDKNGDWTKDISTIRPPKAMKDIDIWRDPVTIEPPVIVLPSNKMTMEIAANSWATSPAGLSRECQTLYDTVSGESFVLNTPDFPEFTDAIEFSIKNKDGWCHKKLIEKASEFGETEIKSTYLRITLGMNQGESPGVPYVLEIWPPDHYSPIHNHADADAIIRVLHGEITVNLYPMLSKHHKEPFARKLFKTGDITWLSDKLNQTHQLHNCNINGPTCITIQCYQYGKANNFHYEYFDYIDNVNQEITQFNPTSDMGFLEFKALMRQEWQGIIKK
ncbi:MAG: Unknown protein [uncultured Sulfurovum sp.]|uniref:Cysteine dioxygenase n=1 Tax=uncultured Sulfurovum sp. TaxID=269237 RepID=A0A6S6U234_9BACT|nr:MAG: Unknown protein [uncultured Sulfurovum sp.]